jgi:hypothetical protein
MTPTTPFVNLALREPGLREPKAACAVRIGLMACRLHHQSHQASQSAQRRVTLPPFVTAGGFRTGIASHTAQFGSKGFVS